MPSIVDLGSLGGILSGPKNIEFIKENNSWYAIVINYSNSRLVRLHFENGLKNIPQAYDLGNLGGWNRLRGLSLIKEGNSVFALVSSAQNNLLSIIKFSNSVEDTPSVTNYNSPFLDTPLGVSLSKETENLLWLCSFKSETNKIIRPSFGNSLVNNSTFSELASFSSSPTEVSVLKEGSFFSSSSFQTMEVLTDLILLMA